MRPPKEYRDYLLGVSDVEELPNGLDSVLTVQKWDGEVWKATIDDHGYVRSLDEQRMYFDGRYCEVWSE